MLSGVLNNRVTKQKNVDLRQKVKIFKSREAERKRIKM
jgi:hypothetical protein